MQAMLPSRLIDGEFSQYKNSKLKLKISFYNIFKNKAKQNQKPNPFQIRSKQTKQKVLHY